MKCLLPYLDEEDTENSPPRNTTTAPSNTLKASYVKPRGRTSNLAFVHLLRVSTSLLLHRPNVELFLLQDNGDVAKSILSFLSSTVAIGGGTKTCDNQCNVVGFDHLEKTSMNDYLTIKDWPSKLLQVPKVKGVSLLNQLDFTKVPVLEERLSLILQHWIRLQDTNNKKKKRKTKKKPKLHDDHKQRSSEEEEGSKQSKDGSSVHTSTTGESSLVEQPINPKTTLSQGEIPSSMKSSSKDAPPSSKTSPPSKTIDYSKTKEKGKEERRCSRKNKTPVPKSLILSEISKQNSIVAFSDDVLTKLITTMVDGHINVRARKENKQLKKKNSMPSSSTKDSMPPLSKKNSRSLSKTKSKSLSKKKSMPLLKVSSDAITALVSYTKAFLLCGITSLQIGSPLGFGKQILFYASSQSSNSRSSAGEHQHSKSLSEDGSSSSSAITKYAMLYRLLERSTSFLIENEILPLNSSSLLCDKNCLEYIMGYSYTEMERGVTFARTRRGVMESTQSNSKNEKVTNDIIKEKKSAESKIKSEVDDTVVKSFIDIAKSTSEIAKSSSDKVKSSSHTGNVGNSLPSSKDTRHSPIQLQETFAKEIFDLMKTLMTNNKNKLSNSNTKLLKMLHRASYFISGITTYWLQSLLMTCLTREYLQKRTKKECESKSKEEEPESEERDCTIELSLDSFGKSEIHQDFLLPLEEIKDMINDTRLNGDGIDSKQVMTSTKEVLKEGTNAPCYNFFFNTPVMPMSYTNNVSDETKEETELLETKNEECPSEHKSEESPSEHKSEDTLDHKSDYSLENKSEYTDGTLSSESVLSETTATVTSSTSNHSTMSTTPSLESSIEKMIDITGFPKQMCETALEICGYEQSNNFEVAVNWLIDNAELFGPMSNGGTTTTTGESTANDSTMGDKTIAVGTPGSSVNGNTSLDDVQSSTSETSTEVPKRKEDIPKSKEDILKSKDDILKSKEDIPKRKEDTKDFRTKLSKDEGDEPNTTIDNNTTITEVSFPDVTDLYWISIKKSLQEEKEDDDEAVLKKANEHENQVDKNQVEEKTKNTKTKGDSEIQKDLVEEEKYSGQKKDVSNLITGESKKVKWPLTSNRGKITLLDPLHSKGFNLALLRGSDTRCLLSSTLQTPFYYHLRDIILDNDEGNGGDCNETNESEMESVVINSDEMKSNNHNNNNKNMLMGSLVSHTLLQGPILQSGTLLNVKERYFDDANISTLLADPLHARIDTVVTSDNASLSSPTNYRHDLRKWFDIIDQDYSRNEAPSTTNSNFQSAYSENFQSAYSNFHRASILGRWHPDYYGNGDTTQMMWINRETNALEKKAELEKKNKNESKHPTGLGTLHPTTSGDDVTARWSKNHQKDEIKKGTTRTTKMEDKNHEDEKAFVSQLHLVRGIHDSLTVDLNLSRLAHLPMCELLEKNNDEGEKKKKRKEEEGKNEKNDQKKQEEASFISGQRHEGGLYLENSKADFVRELSHMTLQETNSSLEPCLNLLSHLYSAQLLLAITLQATTGSKDSSGTGGIKDVTKDGIKDGIKDGTKDIVQTFVKS
eukprot:g146.t1